MCPPSTPLRSPHPVSLLPMPRRPPPPTHTTARAQAVVSCKKANWPAQLPARGNLRFEFSTKKAQRGGAVMEDRK